MLTTNHWNPSSISSPYAGEGIDKALERQYDEKFRNQMEAEYRNHKEEIALEKWLMSPTSTASTSSSISSQRIPSSLSQASSQASSMSSSCRSSPKTISVSKSDRSSRHFFPSKSGNAASKIPLLKPSTPCSDTVSLQSCQSSTSLAPQGKKSLRDRIQRIRSYRLAKEVGESSGAVTPSGAKNTKRRESTVSPETIVSLDSFDGGDMNLRSWKADFNNSQLPNNEPTNSKVKKSFHDKLLISVVSSESNSSYHDRSNAKHSRRNILERCLVVDTNIVRGDKRTEKSTADSLQSSTSSSEYSSTVSKRQSMGGGSSTQCSCPTDERTVEKNENKHFFASTSSHSNVMKHNCSVLRGSTIEVDIDEKKKKSLFGRRRSSAMETLESKKTSQAIQRQESSGKKSLGCSESGKKKENTICVDPILSPKLGSDEDFVWREEKFTTNGRHDITDGQEVEKCEGVVSARIAHVKQEPTKSLLKAEQRKTMPARTNRIKLNVYDLLDDKVKMPLPWGYEFPIGQCLSAVNTGLHTLGTGAYHVGVEINGVEYAYGCNQTKGATGIFSCMPKQSPGYTYRTSIDFGERVLLRNNVQIGSARRRITSTHMKTLPKHRQVDGREVLREMASEYMGMDYNLLRKNCCTFAHDVCLRLGVKEEEIPTWFRNLCVAGALAQDAANIDISKVMSSWVPDVDTLVPDVDIDKPFDSAFNLIGAPGLLRNEEHGKDIANEEKRSRASSAGEQNWKA